MAKVTAEQMAQKWSTNIQNNIPAIVAGVQAVTESPTMKAAAAVSKWQAGIQRAIANNSFVNGCNRVTLNDWKTITTAKIQSNLSSGVTATLAKTTARFRSLLAYIDQGLSTIESMPKNTAADSKARMTAWFDHMIAGKGVI